MDTKGKQSSGGIDFRVISSLVFLRLDSKPRIPVGKNFRILAWIDRDRPDIQYFRRRRLGKRRHRKENRRDHKTDCSNSRSWNHPHEFHFSSSPLSSCNAGVQRLSRNTVNRSSFQKRSPAARVFSHTPPEDDRKTE